MAYVMSGYTHFIFKTLKQERDTMVRFANEQDLNFLKHIWNVCFQDPDDFIAWNFEQNFSYHDTLIAEWDGTPAANLQLMPHRIRLRGHDYSVRLL